jgi:NAD(P)-dependent dehydrogenase (short-subunit alcohol dehydrogenase family)
LTAVRTVVVTGAFGALGSAVARRFLADGARLGLINHGPVPAGAANEMPAPHVLVGGVDLTDLKATMDAMQRIAGPAATLDVLVNVAGGFRFQNLADADLAVWEQMFAMNLKTAVVASRAALPYLRARHRMRERRRRRRVPPGRPTGRCPPWASRRGWPRYRSCREGLR